MSSLIVSVAKINDIKPIEGADKIELAYVLGWQCIVSKGQYLVGDLVIFVPPDSIMPDDLIERYKLEFLKKNNKVGVLKLRKTVSQGLILDLECLPVNKRVYIAEGFNVAEVLGITKWEPPERPVQGKKETIKDYWLKYREGKMSLRRLIKKSFYYLINKYFVPKKRRNPLFSEYTDIENIKNYPQVFEDGEMVLITEKLHGSNSRFANLPTFFKFRIFNGLAKYIKPYAFVYGSRTVEKCYTNEPGWYGKDIWLDMVKKYNLDKIIPKDYTIYGEIIGPEVQDLTYGLKEIEARFFDVKYKDKYLGYEDKIKFFAELKLPTVPILYVGPYSKEIVEKHTTGESILYPEQIREGCVVTSYEETLHPRLGRKILKSISSDYLTRKNGTEFH